MGGPPDKSRHGLGDDVSNGDAGESRRQRGRRSAAIIAIVGLINLPIIKYSVDWWNTLHQSESILRMGGPSIDASMLRPLLIMGLAFTLYFFAVVMARMKAMLLEARHRSAAFAR